VTRSPRTRVLGFAAAAIAALALVGCAPDAPTADPTGSGSPRPSISDTPSSTPSDTPTPAPTATPWVLRTTKGGAESWIVADYNAANPTDQISILSIDTIGPPGADAAHPTGTPKTASGIGLGSTLAQVKAAYPTAATDQSQPSMDFSLRYTEGGGSIVFSGADDIVRIVTVLAAGDENPSEFCG
jgi:hypothetical protein